LGLIKKLPDKSESPGSLAEISTGNLPHCLKTQAASFLVRPALYLSAFQIIYSKICQSIRVNLKVGYLKGYSKEVFS